MKIISKILFLFVLIYSLCLFCSCADYFYPDREPYAGEVITPDQLEEISLALAESKAAAESEKNTPDTTAPPFTPDTDNNGNIIVYWTPNGTVWHIDSGCSSLVRSTTIKSGSESMALESGKELICKKCEGLIEETNK